mgnify:CR=1 FL=1
MERSEERRLKRGPGAISVGRRVRSAKTCRARHALPTVLGTWRDEDRDGSMLLMAFCCVRVAGQQGGGGGGGSVATRPNAKADDGPYLGRYARGPRRRSHSPLFSTEPEAKYSDLTAFLEPAV